jgi:hypothetical protein
MDFYINSESDKEAIIQANKIAKKQRDKFDNHSKVLEVHRTPFASLNVEKLDLNLIYK